jgi:hypothetical protein
VKFEEAENLLDVLMKGTISHDFELVTEYYSEAIKMR